MNKIEENFNLFALNNDLVDNFKRFKNAFKDEPIKNENYSITTIVVGVTQAAQISEEKQNAKLV